MKSNMMFLFTMNSSTQKVLGNSNEHKNNWKRPKVEDGPMLLLCVFNQNAHGTRTSATVAKNELLDIKTKNFKHDILEIHFGK